MRINVEDTKPPKKKTAMICDFVFEKANKLLELGKLDPKIDSAIKQSIKENKGKIGELSIIHTHDILPAKKILIAGLGPKNKLSAEVVRIVTGKIALKARKLNLQEFSIVFPKYFEKDKNSLIAAIVDGIKLSLYSFDKYKKEKAEKSPNVSILVSNSKSLKDTVKHAEIVSDGVIFARDIANLPPNDCPPSKLASFAKQLAIKNNMKCKVFSKKELIQKKFGGIFAVGQGSKNEPKLIVLEYKKSGLKTKPIVVVGKAVTFDTGGISIKPSEKMDEMKYDKCGGCTVLGIMKAVSELELSVNVIGIIPSVENMPGGESYRPGDIIRLYSRKTAEILNTDAEGRLILADGLSYGIETYKPKAIIDFATLTGACIVALGNNIAGLVSNNEGLSKKLQHSSKQTAEEIWQLPLNDDYRDMIKSNVADMRNIGIGRAAGTITAAAFLANAIDDTPWAHIDIAGTAWIQDATTKKPYKPKGATGFGVRLILDYLKEI